jgi:hypothetical protein
MTNVLMIHHCRDFSSNDVYLSDDYQLANNKLYGAQEMDCWAGFRMLSTQFSTFRFQISVNLSGCQLISPKGQILGTWRLNLPTSIKNKISFNYVKALLIYLDTSMAQFSDATLRNLILEITEDIGTDLLWVETQFYDYALPTDVPVIVRSVNFEAKHVLREDTSLGKYFRFLGKVFSEFRVSRRRNVLSISPRDSWGYKILSGHNIPYLPLRQLGCLVGTDRNSHLGQVSPCSSENYFYLAGSTYDVKHNLDNLTTVVEEIAPVMARELPNVHIKVFGNRIPAKVKFPDNVVRMSFQNNFHQVASGSLGAIVPTKGGAGMQSKVFEPLCLGIPLIAHPGALSGYPFNVTEHFWRGSNPEETVTSMIRIARDPEFAIRKARKAQILADSLFNASLLRSIMNKSIREALGA